MKKTFAFVMILLCFSMTVVSAAETTNPAENVAPGNILVNGGLGLFNPLILRNRGVMLVPPLSLSVEFMLPISFPLSLGAVVGYTSSERQERDGDAKFIYTWPVFSIGAKVAYHFKWPVRGLDTYASVTLGANFVSPQTEYNESYYEFADLKPSAGDNVTSFLFGLEVGARFFFNSHVGVFIEEGFNTFTYLRSGLAFKF